MMLMKGHQLFNVYSVTETIFLYSREEEGSFEHPTSCIIDRWVYPMPDNWGNL
jgi:hypothetical protein